MIYATEIVHAVEKAFDLEEDLKLWLFITYDDLFNIVTDPTLRTELLEMPSLDRLNEVKEIYDSLADDEYFDFINEAVIFRVAELREQGVDVSAISELLHMLHVDYLISDTIEENELTHLPVAITMIILSDIPFKNATAFKRLVEAISPIYLAHVKAWNARGRIADIPLESEAGYFNVNEEH